MANHDMSREERYKMNYVRGYRQGVLDSRRECLKRALKIYGKEEGIMPSKEVIHKINREIDAAFLWKILLLVMMRKIPLDELEVNYDLIHCTPEESDADQIYKS